MALARVTSKGQITVPKAVRERLGIQPGDALDFHFQGGRLAVQAVRRRQLAEFRGSSRFPARSITPRSARPRGRSGDGS
jgi:antitoxin PrlF